MRAVVFAMMVMRMRDAGVRFFASLSRFRVESSIAVAGRSSLHSMNPKQKKNDDEAAADAADSSPISNDTVQCRTNRRSAAFGS